MNQVALPLVTFKELSNIFGDSQMENSDSTEKKDKQVLKNGTDFDILCRDEAFWQQTVKNLAEIENSTVNK